MRKFNAVLKEKQIKEEKSSEKKVLGQFKKVYESLLEKYRVPEFKQLSEKAQGVFLSELNSYWSEAEGVSEMGIKFLNTRGRALNEHSSQEQKKNFLQEKADVVIGETIRQTELKYKLYSVIDEMYNEVKASNLSEVLPPEVIFETFKESFVKNIKNLLAEINYELKESGEPKKINESVELKEFKPFLLELSKKHKIQLVNKELSRDEFIEAIKKEKGNLGDNSGILAVDSFSKIGFLFLAAKDKSVIESFHKEINESKEWRSDWTHRVALDDLGIIVGVLIPNKK